MADPKSMEATGSVAVSGAEMIAALRAKRDATTNPRVREELCSWISEVEALALDILIAQKTPRPCPECECRDLHVMEDGEWICHECGFVLFPTGRDPLRPWASVQVGRWRRFWIWLTHPRGVLVDDFMDSANAGRAGE